MLSDFTIIIKGQTMSIFLIYIFCMYRYIMLCIQYMNLHLCMFICILYSKFHVPLIATLFYLKNSIIEMRKFH